MLDDIRRWRYIGNHQGQKRGQKSKKIKNKKKQNPRKQKNQLVTLPKLNSSDISHSFTSISPSPSPLLFSFVISLLQNLL